MPSEVRNLSQLVEKSIFLSIHFGLLGNTRKVKLTEGSAEGVVASPATGIVVTTDADTRYLKAHKTLLESKELDAIRRADYDVRKWLYRKALPYDEVGMVVLPANDAMLDEVETKLRNYEQVERPALVRAFIDAYPRLLEESKDKLGSLYNASDYVPVDRLPAVFTFHYQYISFAVPEFLKTTRYYDEAQRKLQEKFQSAAEEITAVMRQTMLDLVTNLSSQLAPAEAEGKRKKLTRSALEKTQEFLNTFAARNIMNDEELAALVTEAQDLLSTTSIDDLRKDNDFRETMATNMAGLQAQLAALMVDTSPDRKMRI